MAFELGQDTGDLHFKISSSILLHLYSNFKITLLLFSSDSNQSLIQHKALNRVRLGYD